jgi:hypothetical protein
MNHYDDLQRFKEKTRTQSQISGPFIASRRREQGIGRFSIS